MAAHFGEDPAYWEAVGYLHDYDYEQYPSSTCSTPGNPLERAGVDEASIRAILAHGYGLCSEVEPVTPMEKSLFAVDELSGLIGAAARMRPTGLADLEVKSLAKKFKDKALCRRMRPPGHPAGRGHAGHGAQGADGAVHPGHARPYGRPGLGAQGVRKDGRRNPRGLLSAGVP